MCKKFHNHGVDRRSGCTLGKKCSSFHPKVCFSSLFKKSCLKKNCRFHHIKGTRRTEIISAVSDHPSPHTASFTPASPDSLNQQVLSTPKCNTINFKKKNCSQPETLNENEIPKFGYINIQGLINER